MRRSAARGEHRDAAADPKGAEQRQHEGLHQVGRDADDEADHDQDAEHAPPRALDQATAAAERAEVAEVLHGDRLRAEREPDVEQDARDDQQQRAEADRKQGDQLGQEQRGQNARHPRPDAADRRPDAHGHIRDGERADRRRHQCCHRRQQEDGGAADRNGEQRDRHQQDAERSHQHDEVPPVQAEGAVEDGAEIHRACEPGVRCVAHRRHQPYLPRA